MNSNLENLKNKIEMLNKKSHYIAIFKIIHDNNCKYIHNEDGVFINFNHIDSETIEKVQNKINEINSIYQVIKPDDIILNDIHRTRCQPVQGCWRIPAHDTDISKYNNFNIHEKRMLNKVKLDID